MRFQFSKIEKFITETLQILFLTIIVGCPSLSESYHQQQQQNLAMNSAAATTSADRATFNITAVTAAAAAAATLGTSPTQLANTKDYMPKISTSTIAIATKTSISLNHPLPATPLAMAAFTALRLPPSAPASPFAVSPSSTVVAPFASSSSSSLLSAAQHSSTSLTLTQQGYRRRVLTQSHISPASVILNDSNEVDIENYDTFNDGNFNDNNSNGNNNNSDDDDDDAGEVDDDIMTKHIASHATMRHLNKSQDLSAFSLLSFNETTASSLTLGHSGSNSNNNNNSSSSSSSNSNSNKNSKNFANGSSHSTVATFLQIKSQKLALKSTSTNANADATSTAAKIAAPVGSTHTTNSSSSSSNHHHHHNSNSNNNNKHNTKSSRDKVESKLILPKPQKTDAPMLNYIFDMFSTANKHHHHDQRYGPHFEDVQRVGQPTNITVQAGSSVHLNCRISLLQDKTVSWVRRNAQGENALDLMTVGLHTYTGDKRYTMEFQYPNNWRLKITNVKKDDEAMYECQISTHPPRVIQINLHVNAPKVMIVDEFGDPLQEKYYEIDSTLQLSCVVRNVGMSSSVVFWKHGDHVLNYDITRGGVSVKTELMDDGANSTLFIAKINKSDSGNYTCSISDTQEFSIIVHILNGESFAELHHGKAAHVTFYETFAINFVLLILLLCLPSAYAHIHR